MLPDLWAQNQSHHSMNWLEDRHNKRQWLMSYVETRSRGHCQSQQTDIRNISNYRRQLIRSLVTSIFLYACESWTLTAELQRRTQAMKFRCYRKIPRILYKDMLPKRKSVPRSRRQSDHMKTSWHANYSGIDMSPVHHTTSHVCLAYSYSAVTQHGNLHPAVWPILFCGPTREPCASAQPTQEKSGEVLEKKCRWMDRKNKQGRNPWQLT